MASFIFLFFFISVCVTHLSLSSSEIVLPLTHSLSETQFNHTHQLLKSSSVRSTTRFRSHYHHGHLHHRRQISLPLSPGSDYTLSCSLGSDPVQTISLYMDTGSDLVWFPCAPFECILCEGKYDSSTAATTPNVSSSVSVPCNSPVCSAVHSSLPSSDLCAVSRCPLESIEISECSSFACPSFYYAYADGSLIARLYRDSISIPMSSPSLHLKNFTFGCAHTALGEPIGIAGFGRGTLSLPAQLSNLSPHLVNSFSYCLISHSFDVQRIHRPSPLILGRYSLDDKKGKQSVNGEEEFQYTSMLNNPKYKYFYCVGLEAVSVGGSRIPTPERLKKVNRNGDGGMVVDSGTTFTMLPARLYELVVSEFDRRVGRIYERARETEDQTGLGLCYYTDNSVDKAIPLKVPKVAFHFVGNASVVLPTRNYFFGFTNGGDGVGRKRKVGCLMLMNGGDDAESGGPMATLGNYQQQGFEVIYDLEKGRVGFARKQCATLWDSLNRGR
ncbi:probable aspartyl protease At4g16563 [Macadamia integrifolia]|uniref:probable aspartyl protease At4g16563 n=1 Tax=Macadamia integrifolia TaxID=60698 RepID=UPI001C4F37C0|nr:probable aspartyl protease At4g16563 [Macadamia integrifolia]